MVGVVRDGLVGIENGNERCGEIESPLYISNCNGHRDVVKTLIDAGANTKQGSNVSRHVQCQCNTFAHVLLNGNRECHVITSNNMEAPPP